MARDKGGFKFASNFEVKIQGLLDPRLGVENKEDLINKETFPCDGDTIYMKEGMLVTVSSTLEVYMLVSLDKILAEDYSGWKCVSNKGTIAAVDIDGSVDVPDIDPGNGGSNITEQTIADWGFIKGEEGKLLSTEDFTTALKQKLESLNNYDDDEILNAVTKLRTDFDTLVGGNPSSAIESFNEIIAFLEGIEDSQNLDSIIASIEQQIANVSKAIPTKLSSFTNDAGFIDSSALDGYLPSSGGNIYGNVEIANKTFDLLTIKRDSTDSAVSSGIRFKNANGLICNIEAKESVNGLIRNTTKGGGFTIWDEGNDGANSGLDADLLDGLQPSELNVLSASKLTTPRTIWGQSFDGTGNVDGNINVNTNLGSVFYANTTSNDAVISVTRAFAPNLTASKSVLHLFGKSTSANNSANLAFRFIGDGSLQNYVSIGIYGYNDILNVKASGNVLIGTTTDSGYKLDVNGSTRINGIPIYKSQEGALYIEGSLIVKDGIDGYATTTDLETVANNKQDVISDLATIRAGAAKGATALQSYTEKYTGTYSKPSTGIPKSDLASSVLTSLGKADTALQSYTEQYKGTITGVSANGTSVATSGVANIPAASTSVYGVTKLSSATNSTSTELAATASAVKNAFDLAKNGSVPVVTKTSTTETITISPNTFYKWGNATRLTITLGSGTYTDYYNEYIFQFSSNGVTTISLPSTVVWKDNSPIVTRRGCTYIVRIANNCASFIEYRTQLYNTISFDLTPGDAAGLYSATVLATYATTSAITIRYLSYNPQTGTSSTKSITIPKGTTSYNTSLTWPNGLVSVSPTKDTEYIYEVNGL